VPGDIALIPPLVGGFWFVLRCQFLRLTSWQLGQAVAVLLSASFGLVFAIGARTVVWLMHFTVLGQWIEAQNAQVWTFPLSGTSMAAFVLAVIMAELSRFVLGTGRVNSWVIRHFSGDLLALLHESMMRLRPVSVTLTSRKVYIGFVQAIPSLDPEKAYLRILPILSGYRERETLTFRITTRYAVAIQDAQDPRDLLKVLRISSIESANLFDVDLYRKHFGERDKPRVVLPGSTIVA
jgi:hypothetical protein